MQPSPNYPTTNPPTRSPVLRGKDPTLSESVPPAKSKKLERINLEREEQEPFKKRCLEFLYNEKDKSFCGRTCTSWLYIISYSIVYLVFLSTFTCICLYIGLLFIKNTVDFQKSSELGIERLTFSGYTVGLTATPTEASGQPLIWYRRDQPEDYQKYVDAIDDLVVKRRFNRDANVLGPCGTSPFGYGDNPCVIIRINKQLHWSGQPLSPNSTMAKRAPLLVQNWMKRDRKLWLHCEGYNSYDKEHIGRIRYFPDPPGFDPNVFPLKMNTTSPLIAMQITNFTLGISLAVECKLWYANGPSSTQFILYVVDDKTVFLRT